VLFPSLLDGVQETSDAQPIGFEAEAFEFEALCFP
jgi:hypothetical protein